MEEAAARTTSRTERLYQQAISQQERRRAKMAELDRECTFAPTLVSKTKRPTSASASRSKGDRYLRLYEQAKVAQEKRRAAAAKADSEATFSPTLMTKSSKRTIRQGSVFDNLYKKAVDSQARMEKKRETLAVKDCTFAPKINPSSRKKGARPKSARELYDPEWVRRRHDPEANDPSKRELAECTFAPKITSRSGSGRISDAGRGRAVFDKLYSDASRIESKREEAATRKADLDTAECTFTPDLTQTRDALESHSSSGAAAHERLYRQAMDLKARRSVHPDPAELGCTFSPTISEASRLLNQNMRAPGSNRFEEMYTEGLLRQKHRYAEASNKTAEDLEADAECSFHPTITPWPGIDSSSSGDQMPVHERLYANAFNRMSARVTEEDVGPILSGGADPAPAVDGTRRYVQGGELYLI